MKAERLLMLNKNDVDLVRGRAEAGIVWVAFKEHFGNILLTDGPERMAVCDAVMLEGITILHDANPEDVPLQERLERQADGLMAIMASRMGVAGYAGSLQRAEGVMRQILPVGEQARLVNYADVLLDLPLRIDTAKSAE